MGTFLFIVNKMSGENIAVLENDVKRMRGEIQEIKKTQENNHNEIKAMITGMIEDNDKKYASKLTEKVVFGLVWLILTAFWTGLVMLVMK